jgi:6-carboxyhexanoate--CoA ligase
MPNEDLYSVRMRASLRDIHLSGAERIVGHQDVRTAVNDLLDRSFTKSQPPDQISIKIERLRDLKLLHLVALDVHDVQAPDLGSGRALAGRVLVHVGISTRAAALAFDLLSKGPALSGKNMRGAVIMDAETGR